MYRFNHITSSPYWSQSNGRAEAAVKSVKHILLTAEDVDLSLLSVQNTSPAGHTFSPAQHLFGRVLRSDLPQLAYTLKHFTPSRDTVMADHIHCKLKQEKAYDKHASTPIPDLPPGSYIYGKPLTLGVRPESREKWLALLVLIPTSLIVATDKSEETVSKSSLPLLGT